MPATPSGDTLRFHDKENLYESLVSHLRETCPSDIEGIRSNMLREVAIAAVAHVNSDGLCWLFALLCALGYLVLRGTLGRTTETTLGAYYDIVKLAPKQDNQTISLP